MTDLLTSFASGNISRISGSKDAKSLAWNPHPSNAGVNLKHLITGDETEGRFSVHLVKLDPGAIIGEHVHEDHWELHAIVGGDGVCAVERNAVTYEAGDMNVLPENIKHSVQAGKNGLLILAKFIPALL